MEQLLEKFETMCGLNIQCWNRQDLLRAVGTPYLSSERILPESQSDTGTAASLFKKR